MRFHGHYFSEVDDYAIRIYRKRFPDAVPLGDVRNIHGADLPEGEWIITGGFPCQDISVAGKGAGLDGGRSGLWFECARLIGEIRPRFAIVENVGALAVRGLDRVLGSLAKIGYDAIWQDIRAGDVGAPHRRERIWIIVYPHDWNSHGGNAAKKQEIRGGENAEPCGTRGDAADSSSRQDCGERGDCQRGRDAVGWHPEASFKENRQADANGSGGQSEVMADSKCQKIYQRGVSENADGGGGQSRRIFWNGLQGREKEERDVMADAQEQHRAINGQEAFIPGRRGETMADSKFEGLERHGADARESTQPEFGGDGGEVSNAGNTWTVEWQRERRGDQQIARAGKNHGGGAQVDEIGEWWAVEPDVGRVANGIPSRVDRLKCLGNAVVPQITRLIWEGLKDAFYKPEDYEET
ncbi:MAG: DNA cytosine methyltransferase [Treponema sp.]|nr:DNA cytosine methyltransferase [Treponema sp.]